MYLLSFLSRVMHSPNLVSCLPAGCGASASMPCWVRRLGGLMTIGTAPELWLHVWLLMPHRFKGWAVASLNCRALIQKKKKKIFKTFWEWKESVRNLWQIHLLWANHEKRKMLSLALNVHFNCAAIDWVLKNSITHTDNSVKSGEDRDRKDKEEHELVKNLNNNCGVCVLGGGGLIEWGSDIRV